MSAPMNGPIIGLTNKVAEALAGRRTLDVDDDRVGFEEYLEIKAVLGYEARQSV